MGKIKALMQIEVREWPICYFCSTSEGHIMSWHQGQGHIAVLYTKKLTDFRREDTYNHMETYLIYFIDNGCLSQSEESKCMWTHGEDGVKWVFENVPPGGCKTSKTHLMPYSPCLHIHLRKTSVIVKIYQISSHVFVCVFPPEIFSFFGKSFSFLFPFIVLCIDFIFYRLFSLWDRFGYISVHALLFIFNTVALFIPHFRMLCVHML